MSIPVKIVRLTKTYSGRVVLNNVSFACSTEERLVVLGESGVGKTTILKLIAGLDTPDHGEVWIGPEEVTKFPPGRRNIGFVFQEHALWPGKSVYDHLRLPLKWRGDDRQPEARIERILSLVRLWERRTSLPQELSGGQKQRVALARALVLIPLWYSWMNPFLISTRCCESLSGVRSLSSKSNFTSA